MRVSFEIFLTLRHASKRVSTAVGYGFFERSREMDYSSIRDIMQKSNDSHAADLLMPFFMNISTLFEMPGLYMK